MGQGIGYTSLSKLMRFELNIIKITTINTAYYNDNIRSARIFNKLGYTLVKKDNYITLVKYKLK